MQLLLSKVIYSAVQVFNCTGTGFINLALKNSFSHPSLLPSSLRCIKTQGFKRLCELIIKNPNQLAQYKKKASASNQVVNLDLSQPVHHHWFQWPCFCFLLLHMVKLGCRNPLLTLNMK